MPNCRRLPSARRGSAQRSQLDESRASCAGDVDCSAVVRRCADKRQSQRDVDGPIESQRFDRNQSLIVDTCKWHSRKSGARPHGTWCRPEAGLRRRLPRRAALRRPVRRLSDPPFRARRPLPLGFNPDTAMRGLVIPNRERRSATTMRTVSTIIRLDSIVIASRKGRWMVTGTTARSGDHSSITGCGVAFVAASSARNSVWPGWRSRPGEHALGNRIGDHCSRMARYNIVDRMTDRSDRCGGAVSSG